MPDTWSVRGWFAAITAMLIVMSAVPPVKAQYRCFNSTTGVPEPCNGAGGPPPPPPPSQQPPPPPDRESYPELLGRYREVAPRINDVLRPLRLRDWEEFARELREPVTLDELRGKAAAIDRGLDQYEGYYSNISQYAAYFTPRGPLSGITQSLTNILEEVAQERRKALAYIDQHDTPTRERLAQAESLLASTRQGVAKAMRDIDGRFTNRRLWCGTVPPSICRRFKTAHEARIAQGYSFPVLLANVPEPCAFRCNMPYDGPAVGPPSRGNPIASAAIDHYQEAIRAPIPRLGYYPPQASQAYLGGLQRKAERLAAKIRGMQEAHATAIETAGLLKQLAQREQDLRDAIAPAERVTYRRRELMKKGYVLAVEVAREGMLKWFAQRALEDLVATGLIPGASQKLGHLAIEIVEFADDELSSIRRIVPALARGDPRELERLTSQFNKRGCDFVKDVQGGYGDVVNVVYDRVCADRR